MILALLAILAGFVLLMWSADRFVEGAAATAKHAGMPSLLIGMVIVGFGTSAPEMVVSAMAALDGSPGLALGNAYGSNIANTGLILGATAIMIPLTVNSKIVRKELPLLLVLTCVTAAFFWNGGLSRTESVILLAGFFGLIGWSIYSALRGKGDAIEGEMESQLEEHDMPLGKALFWVVAGLILLIVSSRLLVWGAVTIAQQLGVSDLIIGLTIVALGTSLPELAATVVAARKGEHDIAIGNVVGSNMFNLLAVVGIAGAIAPMPSVPPELITRDWPMVMGLTIALFIFGYGFRTRHGRINRFEGAALLAAYLLYTGYLIYEITSKAL
ncbi:calcium/sodium antiporter [Microbulbifer hydrolyticus]|uniref:Calcium/sodium antiporter n=1 Tax=Microbulbifer hydrolyticus TaxID=48074 RepID=A0A6P1TDK1_9GAMM|nr:calcium/sodium antiporter [Microbulbifer hydrolyticus]MBB5212041.1 cation:H+ antiporter [Microbulbifer hydrolyticus]QHQ39723.1 calcium/sodium antiporter [Microbulbifer hydrolyticus]